MEEVYGLGAEVTEENVGAQIATICTKLDALEKAVYNELKHQTDDISFLKRWGIRLAFAMIVVGILAGINVAEIIRGWM